MSDSIQQNTINEEEITKAAVEILSGKRPTNMTTAEFAGVEPGSENDMSSKVGKKKFEITPKSENHGQWFQDLLVRSEMIDYTDVSGCYVLRPWAYSTWEKIKSFLNAQIAVRGVENAYFPMLVSESNLQREADHLEDFAPEVAWIATKEDEIASEGQEKNRERYAIRPTSETIIYPHFANWLKASGQYPKINQWCNVLRWEHKGCTPFIRSREFLWQEGHTCHPDRDLAIDEMWDILNLYRDTYQKILAVPMITGLKTQSEKFPGAEMTSTIEGFLPDSGRSIQAATSHYLGTNFSKIFDIRGGDGELAHQNSWGFTTRSIGIAVMTHSDDKGLVMPPRVAPIQVVLVACGLAKKTPEVERQKVDETLQELQKSLRSTNLVRCLYDNTPKETPGMKFNKWEVKGVPLRIEIGPRDLKNDQVTMIRRDTAEKFTHSLSDLMTNPTSILQVLTQIHDDMYEKARTRYQESITLINDLDETGERELIGALSEKRVCLVRVAPEDIKKTEQRLKSICQAADIKSTKSLCIPSVDALRDYGFGDLLTDDSSTDSSGNTFILYGRSY